MANSLALAKRECQKATKENPQAFAFFGWFLMLFNSSIKTLQISYNANITGFFVVVCIVFVFFCCNLFCYALLYDYQSKSESKSNGAFFENLTTTTGNPFRLSMRCPYTQNNGKQKELYHQTYKMGQLFKRNILPNGI